MEHQHGDAAEELCPAPLRRFLTAPASEDGRVELRGKCGAIVLHILYSLGFLSKADIEITPHAEIQENNSAPGFTSTSACRKLRRTFDSCDPFFTSKEGSPQGLYGEAVPSRRLSVTGVAMIMDALLQVNLQDRHAVDSFKFGGGVTLLHVLLGSEVGLLSDPALLQAAAMDTGITSDAREKGFGPMGGGLLKAAVLVQVCCQDVDNPETPEPFRAGCMALGLPLVDMTAILLLHSERFFKVLSDRGSAERDIDIGAKENKLQEGSFGSADAKSTDHNDYTLGPLESSDNKENQGSPELGVAPTKSTLLRRPEAKARFLRTERLQRLIQSRTVLPRNPIGRCDFAHP